MRRRTGLFHEYVWRHSCRRYDVAVADPASVGQCQLWPRHRAGDHEGRGTCAKLFRAKLYIVPASCGDYWPLYRCITSSGNNIGSEYLRRKGSRRILRPSPSTLSVRVRFFVHRVRERLRANMSRTALLQRWLFAAVRTRACELGVSPLRRRIAAIICRCATVAPCGNGNGGGSIGERVCRG